MNFELKSVLACAVLAIALLPAAAQPKYSGTLSVERKTEGDSLDARREEKQYVDAYHEAVDHERHPGGFDFSISFWLKDEKRRRGGTMECFSGGLGIGFIHTMNAPDNVSTAMGRSLEINWADAIGLAYNINPKNAFSLGMGFLWRNYRMTGRYRFLEAADGTINVAPYPAGANPKFSRLHTMQVTLPLRYIHHFNKKVDCSIGAEFAFNGGINKHTRTLKTRYTLDGERYKDMQRDVHINSANVNLVANLSWDWIGIYARYTPTSAFDTDYGPKFQSLSVGVMLFGF
ncbi:MAG: hypothetical protein K5945_05370 [Bacteroidaceae bacterium]|nr:hypothetical protein [Bacteroidaceae bacterium]